MRLPARLSLARLPTPLQRMDRLSEAWGGPTIWVKRDDLTGFEVSGNKIRKLEFHLAAALGAGADTLITCGAAQSNHCRATALAAPPLGLETIALLRTPDGNPPARSEGNHLLMEIAGARIRYLTPAEYAERDSVMAGVAGEVRASGGTPWVIPEGASDALGMWGYVAAMEELAAQLDGLPPMAGIWHAASSGGTTAGMAWGADRLGMEAPVVGCCIGEPAADVMARVAAIWAEAATATGEEPPERGPLLIDDHVGLGYGLATREELAIQAEATRLTGMLLDPTYTGKALVGLKREIGAGRYGPGDHVVFWHTGGGFAAFLEGFRVVR
ncbi:MAG: pyridoxal-phosphate dependent enzyme [Actinobacteria bacterium]|nr:pyridoxal-phosphate dependent enzyme [Actinomycetota bacterium]MBU1493568.1 pyridoxal-phosphate dependent enzyme [Actinomycetota bacterium]